MLSAREVFLGHRSNGSPVDDLAGLEQEAWGGYSYLEGMVWRNFYFGLRYDQVEDPLDPAADQWNLEPYATWWQSEYVRLRAAYSRFRDDAGIRDHRFDLQVTFAAGPHKHESY